MLSVLHNNDRVVNQTQEEIDMPDKDTSCAVTVGFGHIVYGSYDAVKQVQSLVFKSEQFTRLLGAAQDVAIYRDGTDSYREAINIIDQIKKESRV